MVSFRKHFPYNGKMYKETTRLVIFSIQNTKLQTKKHNITKAINVEVGPRHSQY